MAAIHCKHSHFAVTAGILRLDTWLRHLAELGVKLRIKEIQLSEISLFDVPVILKQP